MIKKLLLLFLLISFVTVNLKAQNDKANQVIESLIEEIAANSDEEIDFSEIYDDLFYFLENPLNLNEANVAKLNSLHFLNDLQINSIINYRNNFGDFKTIYELQLLDGFDMEVIKKCLPFMTVSAIKSDDELDLKRVFKYGKNQFFLRTDFTAQPMSGYNIPDSVLEENPDKTRYLGDPLKYLVKYKFQYRDRVQFGFTAEKDPGEQFFAGAQKQGFDFYSAHLQIDKIWKFKRIVLGDFQVQFGEGLTYWTGMSSGKSSYVLNMKKKPQGIRKYSSTDENLFLRGGGVAMQFGDFSFTVFGSYHKIDASTALVDSIGDEEVREISSIQNTGYHRTQSEVENRHSIGQTVFGGNVLYGNSWMKTGLSFVQYYFSEELIKDAKPYQIFEFQGKSNFNLGWNYEAKYKSFHFFGETAMSQNGGFATLNGLMIPVAHQVSFVTLYRNYSPQYQAFFSGAFAEGSNTFNEKGIYFGIEIYPYQKIRISSYIDSYTFPWLKYRLNSANANGLEYFTQIDYNPRRNVSMYLRYKREIKPMNSDEELPIVTPIDNEKWSLRYNISFQITKNLSLKNRIEFSGYNNGTTIQKGFVAYQDINYKINVLPMSFNFRFAIFDAPYEARIYAYENDVLYASSIPGYFYKGYRTYLVLKYDITKKISVWVKYSQTSYFDRQVISEGSLNEINGSNRSDIKAQMRIKF